MISCPSSRVNEDSEFYGGQVPKGMGNGGRDSWWVGKDGGRA